MSIPGTQCQHAYHYHSPYYPGKCPTGTCQQEDSVWLMALLTTEDTTSFFGAIDTFSLQYISHYMPRYWTPLVEALLHAYKGVGDDSPTLVCASDLYCGECDRYVSKALNPNHWDAICGNCSNHSDNDCGCCSKCDCEECQCCDTCGEAPGWCECCSHCYAAECECSICRDCGEVFYNCSCSSGSSVHQGHGKTNVAPWTLRGDEPIETPLPTIAECDNRHIDPVQAAADFYLLCAIKDAVRLSETDGTTDRLQTERASVLKADSMASAILIAAERSHRALVERLAPSFLAYGIAAVGGELRYHRACNNGTLSGNRDKAWKQFVKVVQVKGPGVLFEADQLFCEFGGGAYGGELWGNAAKVVGRYLNGSMPAWLFVDRVFTLQHNGGCFLNKVTWAKNQRWGLSSMNYLLNAHAGLDSCGDPITGGLSADWGTLLAHASPAVQQMWNQSERSLTRIARRYGGVLRPIVRAKVNSY